MSTVLTIQVLSTLALVGLIWFVQLVHYPLLAVAPERGFPALHREHLRRTGLVVRPLMLTELATAVLLAWQPGAAPPTAVALGLGLLCGIWGMTFAVHVPQHRILSRGFDPGVLRALMCMNWIRTLLWTARGATVLWIVREVGF